MGRKPVSYVLVIKAVLLSTLQIFGETKCGKH